MPVNWDAMMSGEGSDSDGASQNSNNGSPSPQYVSDMSVAVKARMAGHPLPNTPVADSLLSDPAYAEALKEHENVAKLRAVEHQAQGGDANDFWGAAKMSFQSGKDIIADTLTDIKGSFLSAKSSQELVNLRAKQVLGEASDSEAARANYLSARRKPWLSPNSVQGFFSEAPGVVAGMAGSMVGDGDTVGGAILVGAAAGSFGGPAGTVAGAAAGLTAGFGLTMAKSAMGNFYDSMLRVKLPDGKQLDDKVARGAALVLGGINGALGVLPLAGALGKTGLSNVLLGPNAARWLASAVGTPEVAQVLGKIATNFATGMGAQAIIGGVQELNAIAAEHAVISNADPSAYDGEKGSQAFDDELARVKAAVRGGAQLGMGVGGVETALHAAAHPVALYDNVGEVVNQVFQTDKTKAKDYFERVADQHGIKPVTFPRGKLEKFFQDIKLEGDDLKAAMPDVHKQMTDTEGDAKAQISLPMKDVAAYLAPRTAQWDALKGDMRDGNNLTLNEARKLSGNINTDIEALKPQMPPELKPVYDDIYKRLSSNKTTAPVAEQMAALWSSTVNAIADATGKKPAEVHAKMAPLFAKMPEAALDERAVGVPGATVKDNGKYRMLEFDKPVTDSMQDYLGELRERTKDEDIKKDGTQGEFFSRLSKTTGSPTDAARVLGGMGWDGLDTGMTKIVWRPDAILPKADPLKVTRGKTEFESGKPPRVIFSEHATPATVAHELSHIFLRAWQDNIEPQANDLQRGNVAAPDARTPEANAKQVAAANTFEKLRNWLGATDDSGALTPEAEEKFALAFMYYLRDGEAPTVALRPVFDSYKALLTSLYGHDRALGKPLSPEIRQVFDKLVASQKAIDYAKTNLGAPLFDKKPERMTDAQFEKYKREMSNLAATAQSEIEREIFSHMSKEGIDAFEKQKAAVRDELIAKDSTHSLVSFLKTGDRLDGGSIPLDSIAPLESDKDAPGTVLDTHKLDTAKLKQMGVGSDALHGVLHDYHEEGGLDPTLVSRTFGHDDPHAMIQALKSYRPLEQAVNATAASRMPGWVDPMSWLRARAVDKYTGEVVPKMLWAEFQALGGKLGEGAEGNYDLLRNAAENAMRHLKVSSLDPSHFLQEYHRLGEEVQNAIRAEQAAGMDFKKADIELRQSFDTNAKTQETRPLAELLAEKKGGTKEQWQAILDGKKTDEETLSPSELQRRRILAFEQWKYARQALETQSKVNALLDKMRNDIDMRKMVADNFGEKHVEALDSAAAAYGFYEPTEPPKTPISKYVNEQLAKGADITPDPELEYRQGTRTPIGKLSVNQLRHAEDFLTSLYHYITKDLGRFDAGTGPKPLAPLLTRLAKGITDNFQKVKDSPKDASLLRNIIANAITPEHAARLLDGGDPHGDFARAVIQPVEEGKAVAEAKALTHDKALLEAIKPINDGSLAGDSSLKVRDSESTDRVSGRKIASPGRVLTKTELVSAMLNFGSSRNRWALTQGYGVTENEFLSAFGRDLSAKHIEFANKFWAEHDKYFPDAAETYAKRTGLILEAVKPVPFTVKFADGTKADATGGYVPIKMSDKVRNERAAQDVKGSPSNSFEVRDDMTMERQGSYGPVELNLARVLTSVHAKIHYAALADPVAQVSKIILSKEVRDAVGKTLGPEFNDQLFKWLRDTARDGAPLQPLQGLDKVYRYLLSGVSQSSVGFNHLTAAKQLPFAISQASTKVGAGNMALAIRDVLSDWKGSWERGIAESAVLRRFNEDPTSLGIVTPFDPNISIPLATRLQQIGHGSVFKTASDVRAYMSELGMAHQNNVRQMGALFAYEAAKRQAIAENRPDVTQYADAIVRQTVGGGDASNFMREPGMARGTVMLYSHMSLIASEMLSSGLRLTNNGMTKEALLGLTASLLGFVAAPSLASAVVSDDINAKGMPNASSHPGQFALTMLRWEILAHTLSRSVPLFGDALGVLVAPDKPANKIAGGPLGEVTGDIRGIISAVTNPKKRMSDAVPFVAKAASLFTKTPANHIYRDIDLLEGITSGRYGQDAHRWYDIMAHGPKQEGFK